VILPKAVGDRFRWDAGTRLLVEETAEGVLLKPLEPIFPPTRPEDVYGCLRYDGKLKTIEEMDAGVTAEIELRRASGRY
jgi:bifunctional DNA-binding transcriptional regulator/antitoxin component of YhaV-PrlF toxin-antitoxin module